jgi:hypothetical protein
LPRPGDLEIDELLRQLDQLIAKGATVFVKWTCPSCGDRCVADEPNQFHPEGYTHTTRDTGAPCGTLYVGPKWGIRAIYLLEGGSCERD